MSNLDEAIRQLEQDVIFAEWSRHRKALTRSKTRAQAFAENLTPNPVSSRVPKIGVVGSKGKGTAVLYASATLAGAGLHVGSIFSPGVISNRDRIVFDGKPLSDAAYEGALARAQAGMRGLPEVSDGYLGPSGIFLLAGAATLIQMGADVLVLEAGMGGSSDEISLFSLDVVVITEIFGEHLDILGPTVRDVAVNKSAVITTDTHYAFSHKQSSSVAQIIERRCEAQGSKLRLPPFDSAGLESLLPPGNNTANALLGLSAGSAMAEIITGTDVTSEQLKSTLASVTYPGRLSMHPHASGTVLVDSAINRNGLVSALTYARTKFGGLPDRILACIPATKDVGGFVQELQALDVEKVFVDLPDSHLTFPSQDEWPWQRTSSDKLDLASLTGNTLAVGTISFSGWALEQLDAHPEQFFQSPRTAEH